MSTDPADFKEVFLRFRQEHAEEILAVKRFIVEPLPDNAVEVNDRMRMVPAHMGRLAELVSWSVSFHKTARAVYIKPKSKEVTELEREVHLESDTAEYRRFRETLEGYADALETLFKACQSYLATARQERNTTIGA